MKVGKGRLVGMQVALGVVLVAEFIWLTWFFAVRMPAMIAVFVDAEMALPSAMVLVLDLGSFLRHYGCHVAVLLGILAAGWLALEFTWRSEAKHRIRLAVGGVLVLLLALLIAWVALVSSMAVRHVERHSHDTIMRLGPAATLRTAHADIDGGHN